MQTILVPVDFSAVSRNAAEYAAHLARQLNARLVLFHAYMLPTPVSEVPYVMVTVEELQKENENHIKKEAEHLHAKFNMEVEWIVRIGIPSDEIKHLAIDKNAGLIVMGIKGAGGLDKIMGSTTNNVIRKSKTAVLVIPENAGFKGINHITYASDFSYNKDLRVFGPLLDIIQCSHPALHIIHVQKDDSPAAAHAQGNDPLLQKYHPQYHIIRNDSVTQGISEYLTEHSSDLLIMVAHKHSFLERIFSKTYTTAMTYETSAPLLVLQQKD